MSNLKIFTMSELCFTSPDSVMTKDGEVFVIESKKLLKKIMSSLEFVDDKFTKELYNLDETYWSNTLSDKFLKLPFSTDYSAIAAGNNIVSVVANTNRNWLDTIELLTNNRGEEVDCQVNVLENDEGFSLLCIKDDWGYVVNTNIPENNIKVQNVCTRMDCLYITPFTTVNCYVDSGVDSSDFEELLMHEVLYGTPQYESVDSLVTRLIDYKLSYAEALDFLKVFFDIKIKSSVKNINDYFSDTDQEEYSEKVYGFKEALINEIYSKGYQFIPNSNKLEKQLKFVKVSALDTLQAATDLFYHAQTTFDKYDKFSKKFFNDRSDYQITSNIFPELRDKF